jgi:ribosomal silencing factor RsfS
VIRWHCYENEAVISDTVEAGDAFEAAEIAARNTGAAGRWMVIALGERGVVHVDVREVRDFAAVSVDVAE